MRGWGENCVFYLKIFFCKHRNRDYVSVSTWLELYYSRALFYPWWLIPWIIFYVSIETFSSMFNHWNLVSSIHVIHLYSHLSMDGKFCFVCFFVFVSHVWLLWNRFLGVKFSDPKAHIFWWCQTTLKKSLCQLISPT